MANNKIIFDEIEKEEEEFKLREEETNKALREVLNSIKRKEWTISDYDIVYDMLEADFRNIGEVLYTFYWKSGRRREDAEKAINTIRNIINKEILMEKITESGIEIELGEYGKRINTLIKDKIKKEEWIISDYSLMFDHLLFELHEIKSILDMYDKSVKTIDNIENFLWKIRESFVNIP